MRNETTDGKTIVQAPQPQPGRYTSNAVLSVALAPDEEVEWQWTHYPDGSSAVTGYIITKRQLTNRS
jgi:hypothetical protein